MRHWLCTNLPSGGGFLVLALAFSILLLIVGCSENSGAGESHIDICPSEDTLDTEEALGISETDLLTLEELLARIADRSYIVELGTYGVSRFACAFGDFVPGDEVYIIHAGFDRTRSYTRHFYIITDSNNYVRQIEVRRAYVIPGG